jgi:hypothetical protein
LSTKPQKHADEWGYISTILNLGSRWKCVVSFMPLLLYRWLKSPQYSLSMMLGVMKKIKISHPSWESNLDSSVIQSIVKFYIQRLYHQVWILGTNKLID